MKDMNVEQEKGLPRVARLYNRGSKTYDQVVSGDRIVIEPGEFKEFPRRTAVQIMGKHCGKFTEVSLEKVPVMEKGFETDTPEAIDSSKERVYVCPKCNSEYANKDDVMKCCPARKRGRKSAAQNKEEPIAA